MLVSRTHWRIHGTPPYFKTKPRPGSPLSQGLDGRPPPRPALIEGPDPPLQLVQHPRSCSISLP